MALTGPTAREEIDTRAGETSVWVPGYRPWSVVDLLALAVWTAAIAIFFRDPLFLRKALFYFDITEINYPYRDFLAREIRLGRFSRWMPGLYCGFPLYSESQAGYWHPFKYLLYPWFSTWRAFNLDTVLSVWLTGLATFGWLRRHVGPAGALTGAAIFGLSGFVWAHLIHTSMTNALISVPLVLWALESAWESGRLPGLVLGGLAIACQVFAGHLQDTILTAGLVGLYTLHRVVTERTGKGRLGTLGFGVGMVSIGVLLSGVQWIPSKELLDRSPRAEGLSWGQLTYGSWSPELLPTLIVREAYGTRARDTDWMDGFYPYHEMNAYLGLIALALAVIGGAACRDRWVAFWVGLALIGAVLMLGRFTIVFDQAHRIPVLGSSRIPVRYHLWVSAAVAALAAVGVDRLSRPGRVRLRRAGLTVLTLVGLSIPILAHAYAPVWTDPARWTTSYHINRYGWLGRELAVASGRTGLLVGLGWFAMTRAGRAGRSRPWIAAALPVLVIADLLGSHSQDVPTIDPDYWTTPPSTADRIRSDPDHGRIFGIADRSAGEPGYASEQVDFLSVRDPIAWSLAPVWGLHSSSGETPIIPRRMLAYTDYARLGAGRFAIEGVSHLLTKLPSSTYDSSPERVGTTFIHRVRNVKPRARLAGHPVYASGEDGAVAALRRLGPSVLDRLVVEDPDRPLAEDAAVSGTATILLDDPERVEIATDSRGPSYLVLSDTIDPGWSATVDGLPAPIRPAYVAFRAVYLRQGSHRVVFSYTPAGFRVGLLVSVVGLIIAAGLLFRTRRVAVLDSAHEMIGWPRYWPTIIVAAIVVLVVASAFAKAPDGSKRWRTGYHQFTWGAGLEAIPSTREALGR